MMYNRTQRKLASDIQRIKNKQKQLRRRWLDLDAKLGYFEKKLKDTLKK